MYAQILQIGLAEHSAHGVRHAADAQLETCAVGYPLHNEPGHRLVHLGGRTGGLDTHGVVAALHHHVHLADVDAVVEAAQTAGHVLVDLHDDHLGHLAHSLHMGRGQTEVEIAVLVHGRHLKHGHVRRCDMVVVVAWQLGIAHGLVEPGAAGDMMALHAAHVMGIENDVVYRILDVEDSRLPQADAAAYLHILQLRGAAGQRLVQHAGMNGAEPVVHPVAGFDDLHRFVGGGQLLAIHLLIIGKRHGNAPPFSCFSQLLILTQTRKMYIGGCTNYCFCRLCNF